MKIRIAKCTQEDIDSFDGRAFPAYFCEAILPALRKTLLDAPFNHSFSLFIDDQLSAIGGFAMMWEGVAEVWVALSRKDLAKKNLKKILLAFHSTMQDVCISANLRRLQCTVRADSLESMKFVEALGFQSEGILEKYGADGADHVMYSQICYG